MRAVLFLIGAALLCSGCGDRVCAGVEMVRAVPGDTTIHVGDSFTMRAEEGGSCDEVHITDPHPVSLTWTTRDTLIVQVDSTTGRVTGRSPGDAHVAGDVFVVTVHVRAAGK